MSIFTIFSCKFLLYKSLFFPCSTEISDDEANTSEYPVDYHRYPDSKYADSHKFPNDIAESDTENPHGKNGYDHA